MHYNLDIQCCKDCKTEFIILFDILHFLVLFGTIFSMPAGELDNFDITEQF